MGKKKEKAARAAATAAAAAAGGGAPANGGNGGGVAASGGNGGAAAAAAAPAAIPWADIDRDPVAFLVAPEPSAAFFADTWERRPRVFKATPGRAALAASLTTLPALLSWAAKRERADGAPPLAFGRDVNAARYVEGSRETPNGEGLVGAGELAALHDDEGCTLQVHQPQRWDDGAWRLLAALEAQLGVLVGANAYLTPPGAQGLAPHHDDVEIWVVQTAGTKHWRCYAPVGGFQLPNACSGDLPQEIIGEPVLDVTLAVGDVLYMPRGTVHQAVAGGAAASAHLTISTYQHASYADLALSYVRSALAAPPGDEERAPPLAARRGVPPGLAFAHSLEAIMAAGPPAPSAAAKGGGPIVTSSASGQALLGPGGAVAGLAGALRALADGLEAAPDALTPAVLDFSRDFWAHRLPPHPGALPDKGPAPDMQDAIWFRAKRWACLMPHEEDGSGSGSESESESGSEGGSEEGGSGSGSGSGDEPGPRAPRAGGAAGEGGGEESEDDEEEEEEESDEGDEPAVKLVTCLFNRREAHMIGLAGDAGASGSGSGSESDLEGAGALLGRDDSEEGASSGDSPSCEAIPLDSDGEGGGESAAAAAEGVEKRVAKLAAAAAAARGGGSGGGGGAGNGGHEHGREQEHHHHHHEHEHEHGGGCCGGEDGEDGEGASEGEKGHSGGRGGGGPRPLPGIVFSGGDAFRALLAILGADAPAKAVPIRTLPLEHDADKLHLAFALWAEGFVAVRRGGRGGGGKRGKGGGGSVGGGGAPAAKRVKGGGK